MKKTILCLMAFFLMVTMSYAVDVGQICTMKKGSTAVQKFPNPMMPYRGVIVPADQEVTVLAKISDQDYSQLEARMPPDQWNENWSTAFDVTFEYDFGGQSGKQVIFILIREADMKDCKPAE